ncbi:cysteine desulfurase family protein [Sphingobacterium sp. UBA6645]|uniref:cysteine desulfurase family protein n=1 Tax=Sphingobacterium sp. UBA6645 TaxID=1947511 RepID=UPI0025CBFABA|nr:cysteine desulfurase family protein [Sphingobacterium sp. UBA6645]
MSFLYFDNNATSRMDDEVLQAMLPYLQETYGNASSVQHKLGRAANTAIERARIDLADRLGCTPKEIYFTSGATESISTVLKGIAQAYNRKGKHIITCKTEHKAVLATCESLGKQGYEITYLDVDAQGNIDLEDLRKAIRADSILVSLMSANNETGVLHPIEKIANICQEKDVLFFCDATQHVGKLPIDLQEVAIDILCLSAHKFHGPKGIGALFIRRKSKPIQIPSLVTGGNQEHGLRGGTYAVPQIVGMGEAVKRFEFHSQIETIRDYFESELQQHIEEATVHARSTLRIPNTSNVLIKHVRSTELMTKVPEMALSSGSACVSGSRDPSHVLKAMGMDDEDVFCSSRFSFSKYTTNDDIDLAIQQIKRAVTQIREASPIWQMYKEGLI